jgi:hypothetical protein
VEGGDGWSARQRQFCRRRHVGAELGKNGENGPDKRAPFVSDGDVERKARRARTQRWAECYSNRLERRKNVPDPFSI